MSDRIFNFGAGPAVLPEPVLRQAQQDIWNIAGSGMGIMELSHRGKVYDKVHAEAEQLCRELAGIPEDYRVLFLQAGASLQFSMVPMNLLPAGRTAEYIITGVWSEKALKEAKLVGKVNVAASTENEKFIRIPRPDEIRYSTNPAYVHFTSNNTIYGTQWRAEPAVPAGVPLACDASSDIFSRPIEVKKYGLIYAGAQKNLGPSGVVLVIIRNDLVEAAPKNLPTMLQYRTHAKEKSLYHTPPTFGIYMMGQVFKWLKQQGGLAGMAAVNETKATVLYDYLDQSKFFRTVVERASRSRMNVCFRSPSEELDTAFVKEATAKGFEGLKGHRSAGGMRASLYNAMTKAGVEALVGFMREFEKANAEITV